MLLSIVLIVIGLGLLVWSADLFVDGAAAVARSLGMSTLLVGMIVIGFGTSAPEMSVSVLAAMQGNPGIALGNAYGSNIANIALVLGATALISPIVVRSQVLKKELPILLGVTFLAYFHLQDGQITRLEALIELVVLLLVFTWMTIQSRQQTSQRDALETELEGELEDVKPLKAWGFLIVGLVLLVISSRMLVVGAVDIAQTLGVSDLIIGLTVVAIGTSLPELAASIAAARKGEHDLAVGNVIGSNLFNTLAVVGLAGAIHPMQVPAEVLSRDWMLMFLLTVLLFVLGYGRKIRGEKSISRLGGGLLVAIYIGYTLYLIASVIQN
ncbi:MAG: calcium/sodium antiporter [Methylophilaceae bacterium]